MKLCVGGDDQKSGDCERGGTVEVGEPVTGALNVLYNDKVYKQYMSTINRLCTTLVCSALNASHHLKAIQW